VISGGTGIAGNVNIGGYFNVSGSQSGTPSTTGVYIQLASSTFTDSATAASGTAATMVFNSIAVPTLIATNTSVTTTNAATFYIAGNPITGTNETITNSYGFWNVGNSRIDGTSVLTGTTASTSSTTGVLQSAGGVSISNSTNSSSNTNGGALTIAGGAAIAKDVYIGGNLNIAGSTSSGLSTPSITTSNTTNITGSVTVVTNKLILNGNENFLSVVFRCTPTSSGLQTSFQFTTPNITSFVNIYDMVISVNGFHTDSSPVNLENLMGYAVTGTTRTFINFTAGGTDIHTIQIIARYTSN
jgi:hypothetical protein